MPLLNWANDIRARSAASQVPFHLLKKVSTFGDENSAKENLLIQGDNLLALKALLPFYREKVKCIYIDPPYNTMNAFEYYDDNLEHSQWLSMMYPRLALLKEFLKEDGVIFINLDEEQQAHCHVILGEIFGRKNFIGDLIWQKKEKVEEMTLLSLQSTMTTFWFMPKTKPYIKINGECLGLQPIKKDTKKLMKKGTDITGTPFQETAYRILLRLN